MRYHAYGPMTGSASGSQRVEVAPAGAVTAPEARPELADVSRLWRRAVRGVVAQARSTRAPAVSEVLIAHLDAGGERLPVLEERWAGYDHVNLQAGVDAWLAQPGRRAEVIGLTGMETPTAGLADLLSGEQGPNCPRVSGVSRISVAAGPGGVSASCVRLGLYLVTEGADRVALLLRGPTPEWGRPAATLEVVGRDPAAAAAIGAEIRALALRHNVFRRQVVSFGGEVFGPEATLLHFHDRPRLTAAQLILNPATLAAVERQVVGVSRHRLRLIAAGQHLKRGLLLYGPPGAGKTHTVRYLMSRLTDTTVILLAGNALHLVAEACSIARTLQPAMVVIEDVDLIAEDRGMHPGRHPLLFQLLNEMDGLAEDTDVVFVLTTNRPDLLEPALASRPGRVDQAVELTLPDLAARRALFDLYRAELVIAPTHGRSDDLTEQIDGVLERCDGVTASFVKEMLRRAAVQAAERHPDGAAAITVSVQDLHDVVDDLLDQGNSLTRILLGAGQNPDAGAPFGAVAEPGIAPTTGWEGR
jgi:hypothetical protein